MNNTNKEGYEVIAYFNGKEIGKFKTVSYSIMRDSSIKGRYETEEKK